jgi:acyl-CoA synthetase (AMP-forming)/AMP-acid ligase II
MPERERPPATDGPDAAASTVGTWTFADLWEAAADRFADRPAQRCGDRTFTWHEFDRRADGVAAALVAAGLGQHAKVAQYLFNGPEYLEVHFACSKAGLVPVNTNYRYTGPELRYLWDNAEVEAVVLHGDLAATADEVRPDLPRVKLWLWVDAGDGSTCPAWATPYEDAAGNPPPERVCPWPRDGQELNLLYTGGTTGHPKGVMWPQDTLIRMLEELNGALPADDETPAAWVAALDRPGPTVLPAAPLMHGTALWYVLPSLARGGCVVTIPSRRLDVAELLDTIVADGVKGVCIVGEAFARPILDALGAEPDRWDLSGLRVVFTSGAIMRADTKATLLRHAPRAQIIDSLGSSESGGLAKASSSAGTAETDGATASFRIGPNTRVVADDGTDVVPGSGQEGRIAIGGWIPLGYYGDETKTAETFLRLDGRMHVVAGDRAQVEADGTLKLLGRGSQCINTGGEKVFPEEVEEALKGHPTVRDAIVVGLPDDRFGEAVTAVVEATAGAEVDEDVLREAVRGALAGYKAPRRVVAAPIDRAPNGKADYRRLRALAAARLGVDLP